MTKGLLAKFKKQYGKDGMFASLSLWLHKGFEAVGSTAGRVKNEDEPQVRSERQIKEEQYINLKQHWLFFFFFLAHLSYITLSTAENQIQAKLLLLLIIITNNYY